MAAVRSRPLSLVHWFGTRSSSALLSCLRPLSSSSSSSSSRVPTATSSGGSPATSTPTPPPPPPRARRVPPHRSNRSEVTESYEFIAGTNSSLLWTAEHASVRLPPPNIWPAADADRVVGTHWSYDPGSADICRELAAATGGMALLSRFSRLLIDPNRPLTSDTLFRDKADGQPVQLNANLTDEDRVHRMQMYYMPYHTKLNTVAKNNPVSLMISLHSYTNCYEGTPRKVEVGVLCNNDESLAPQLVSLLKGYGYDARLNEPWSGKEGFMFAIDNASQPPKRRSLMLEFRNDLLTQPAWRATMVDRLLTALRQLQVIVEPALPTTEPATAP